MSPFSWEALFVLGGGVHVTHVTHVTHVGFPLFKECACLMSKISNQTDVTHHVFTSLPTT